MKKFCEISIPIILLLPLVTCKSHSQCASEANVLHFTYNGKNYEIIKELKTWADAAACAVERGGKLVEINDLYEQTAVYNALAESGISNSYSPVRDGGGTSYVWIGATDKNNEGTWLWDGNNDGTGTAFWNGQGAAGTGGGTAISGAHVNWGGTSITTYQEPDNYGSGQDAAAMAMTGWPYGSISLGISGEWNDINTDNAIYFIVEYDSSSVKNNENSGSKFTLSPNPCHDLVSISGTDKINSVKIFDSKGLLVLGYNEDQAKEPGIKVDTIKAGNYFMLIEGSGHNFYTLPFVKE